MYRVIEWSPNLDLRDFYLNAASRGFRNNSSQKRMVDNLKNEREWNVWILYQNNRAIGSVASHSFDDVVPNSYRILTRVCTFGEARQDKGLITPKKLIAEHQNLTDQFLLPTCLDWVSNRGRVFATSNASKIASQHLVHKYYFPTLEKKGLVKNCGEIFYRKTSQTLWEIYPEEFMNDLEKYEKWH